MGLALAKHYKPSSTLTTTKANASPGTPIRRPRGRLPRRLGPGPNPRGHAVGCQHGGASQVGALAWPWGGGLGLARVRVSRVRVLAQRDAAKRVGSGPNPRAALSDAHTVEPGRGKAGFGPEGACPDGCDLVQIEGATLLDANTVAPAKCKPALGLRKAGKG